MATDPTPNPTLVLGPMLRYVDATSATIWLEVSGPGTVTVLGHSSPTFSAWGRHYALVVVEGLEPGVAVDYDVSIDGEVIWPAADALAPSTIVPTGPGPLRVATGSCRVAAPEHGSVMTSHGEQLPDLETDALSALGTRLLADPATRPDLLVLGGDQLYSDALSPATLEYVSGRRTVSNHHDAEVMDADEYAFAYRDSWAADPAVRWLLSTVPTAMIFDDHDLHNGWNSSAEWVEDMRSHDWWPGRAEAALGTYWIYQHLGNLSPADLLYDPVASAALAGEDIGDRLADLARRTMGRDDGERPMWSHTRRLGEVSLVVLDSRSARVLDTDRRSMLGERDWRWVTDRIGERAEHILLVTSVPVVLSPAVVLAERVADHASTGVWGRPGRRVAHWAREEFGLEHWPAYDRSDERLTALLADAAAGRGGTAPTDVLVVSGEVHFGYVATLDQPGAPVVHLVSSPLRNPSSPKLQRMHRVSRSRVASLVAAAIAKVVPFARSRYRWRDDGGPWFRNLVATVTYGAGSTEIVVERTLPPGEGSGFEVVHRQVV